MSPRNVFSPNILRNNVFTTFKFSILRNCDVVADILKYKIMPTLYSSNSTQSTKSEDCLCEMYIKISTGGVELC